MRLGTLLRFLTGSRKPADPATLPHCCDCAHVRGTGPHALCFHPAVQAAQPTDLVTGGPSRSWCSIERGDGAHHPCGRAGRLFEPSGAAQALREGGPE